MQNVSLECAWGNKTLIKARIHPIDIGVMLAKMNPDQIKETIEAMMQEIELYRTETNMNAVIDAINEGMTFTNKET